MEKPYWIFITGEGRTADDLKGDGQVTEFVRGKTIIVQEGHEVRWFGSEQERSYHPAVADFNRLEVKRLTKEKTRGMRSTEIYTGKALDVQNFMLEYTQETAPPLCDEAKYPELHMETMGRRVNSPEITSYDVCLIIWPKVLANREIEKERIALRESIA